jgi:helicase MOV-10
MPSRHPGNCPEVLVHGICNAQNCPHNHAIPICETCLLVFNTEDDYQYHLTTNEHCNGTTTTSNAAYCSICETNVAGGRTEWINHVQGPNHCTQAHALGVSPNVPPQSAASTKDTSVCELCDIVVENSLWNVHLGSAKHVSREAFIRYKAAMEEAEADKHGVAIEGVFDFDCIAPQAAKRGVNNSITIRATRQHTRCILFKYKLTSPHSLTSG